MIPTQQFRGFVARRAERSITLLADALGAGVDAATPAQLEALMGSPARRLVLEAIFRQMPRQLDAGRARGVSAGARWRVTSRHGEQVDVYDLLVSDGHAHVRRGGGEEAPSLTITVDGAEFLRIVSGRTDPVQAYFKRRMALRGDIMGAAKLVSLFRIPGSRPAQRTA